MSASEVLSPPAPLPLYDSAAPHSRSLEEARALWKYRGLVHELVVRDIKVRYKRSVLGIAWTMLAPLLIILVVTHFPIYTTWFFLPVAVAIETLFAAGVGLWLFTFASRFSDVREMYIVIVQTWFFLTPIVYHPAIVPPKFRFALWLNPLYYLVQTFRKPVYDGVLPSVALVAVSAGLALVVFVSGWIYFARRAERFAFHS